MPRPHRAWLPWLARKLPTDLCPAIKAPSSPLLARDTEPRRGHHCRRRRVPCSARARCHLSTPKASSHTQRACTPAYCLGHTPCSPLPSSRRRVPLPTCSPCQPTLPGPPLGRRGANRATRCSAPSPSSSKPEQPRPPSPVSAAPAPRSDPHPPTCGQSTLGEGNRAPGSLAGQHWAHIAGGKPSPPPRTPRWGIIVHEGLVVNGKDSFVKVQNF
jgi:hypothetical protein